MKRRNDAGDVQGKAPGFWYYPSEFERDVQMLSLPAQGVWIRMLGWMHENEAHRGFLELPTGEPMEYADIAAKLGKPLKQVEAALSEMRRIGLFSVDTRGCIFNRRMARETHISTVRKAAANSRLLAAKRAADGTFAGDFAGAKQAAKEEQNPAVSVSDSDSVSASSTTPKSPPVSPSKTDPELPEPLEDRLDSIRQFLADYVGGEWGLPDDGIVVRIHEAIRGAPLDDLQQFLLSLHKRGQRPRQGSWGWFHTVIDSQFASRRHHGSTHAVSAS